MSREKRTSLKSELASAIAEGKSSAEWASANWAAERTAQRWANEPETRAEVELIRRGSLDQAVGRMSQRVAWATEQIATLAESAKSVRVDGPSGLLAVAPPGCRPEFTPSNRRALEPCVTRL